MCNNAHLNSDDLRFILTLGRERTLIRAARELGVSHTTVARRVAALEVELGTRLFDKTERGQVLTRAGEEVVAVGNQVVDLIDSLDRQLLGRDVRLSGKLRVTTIDALVLHYAQELGGFKERYPAVELDVTVENRARNLTKREADVAIRFSRKPPQHLVGRKLGLARFALYGSEELIAAQRDPLDLSAYPWLGWDGGIGVPDSVLAKYAAGARPMFRVDSVMSMWAAIRAGIGVSLLACMWADRTEGLRRIRDAEPGLGVDLWVLTHPDLRDTARIRAFTDYFCDAMRPHAALMAGKRPLAAPLMNG
jgi:DNA-binding transcriptional LysR family regulator